MSELVLHPNSPRPVAFECPACGRECLLTPLFGQDGAARGVRLGHGVQHSVPACRTFRTMPKTDFMVLATSEVPIIRDDVHVSVKLPEAPPLIFSDGGKAGDAAALERAEQEQARDVAVYRGEAAELARVRDWIVQREELERMSQSAKRWAWSCVVVAAVAAAMLLVTRSPWWALGLLADVAGVVYFTLLRMRIAARASSSLGSAGPPPRA